MQVYSRSKIADGKLKQWAFACASWEMEGCRSRVTFPVFPIFLDSLSEIETTRKGEDAMMFCTHCGASLSDEDHFCSECGLEVVRLTQETQAAVDYPAANPGATGTTIFSADQPLASEGKATDTDQVNWVYGFAGKNKTKIYADTQVNSVIIAQLPAKSPLYLGQEQKVSTGSWFGVMLPDGQLGYVPKNTFIISEPGMVSTIKSWAGGMIFIGVLSILLSSFLDPVWGILLIFIGIIALKVHKRGMFIVFGLVLVTVGLMNMMAGGQWMIFGGLQIVWGISEFYKFTLYGVLGSTQNPSERPG